MYCRSWVTVSIWVTSFVVFSSPVFAQKMYWADAETDKIMRANLDGSDIEEVISQGPINPWDVAIDINARMIYWGELGNNGNGKLMRANLDGSNVEQLIDFEPFQAIAVDSINRKVYWTFWQDFSSGITRSNLDGSNVEILLQTGLSPPLGIAIDAQAGKMYWPLSAGMNSKIQRANLDATDIEDLVDVGPIRPQGIALDTINQKMYWAGSLTGVIQRANFDGSGLEDLITSGLDNPTKIALDLMNQKMYWTGSGLGTIQRSNLDGSDVEIVLTTGTAITGITIEPLLVIPATSIWGIIIMTLLVLLSGIIVIRRRSSLFDERTVSNKPCMILLFSLVVTAGESQLMAQPADISSDILEVVIDSGQRLPVINISERHVVYAQSVSYFGAPWMRLHFQTIELGPSANINGESLLKITSLKDGAVQILNAQDLKRWRNTSAYFNGDELLVEILASPGAKPSRVVIDQILYGDNSSDDLGCPVIGGEECTDHRVASVDPRSARLRYSHIDLG